MIQALCTESSLASISASLVADLVLPCCFHLLQSRAAASKAATQILRALHPVGVHSAPLPLALFRAAWNARCVSCLAPVEMTLPSPAEPNLPGWRQNSLLQTRQAQVLPQRLRRPQAHPPRQAPLHHAHRRHSRRQLDGACACVYPGIYMFVFREHEATFGFVQAAAPLCPWISTAMDGFVNGRIQHSNFR